MISHFFFRSSKTLIRTLAIILIATCVLTEVFAVHADVDINVLLEDGNATIDLMQVNGTAKVTVNNIDVIEEWKESQKQANAYMQMLYYMSARADVDDVEEDIERLEEDLIELIEQLNAIFPEIENRDITLFKLIGVDHNSSVVIENLRSMNVSVADYLELHEEALDSHYSELLRIQRELGDIGEVLSSLEESTHSNNIEIDQLQTTFSEETEKTYKRITQLEDNARGMFIVQSILSGGVIVILLTLVYTQNRDYMRLRTRINALDIDTTIEVVEEDEETSA